MEQSENYRYIIRIANTDLDGKSQLSYSLAKIKGISYMFANAVCYSAKVDKTKRMSNLNDEEIKRIDEVIKDPAKFGIPVWLFNRKKDPVDNSDRHLLTTDLTFSQDNDVKMMKKMRCYKGIRHMLGLPVRGQRTRSNFRKNKGKVNLGVQRKQAPKKEDK